MIAVVAVDGDAPFEFDVFNAEPGDAHEVGTVPVCRFEEGVRTGITAEGAGFGGITPFGGNAAIRETGVKGER